MRSLMKLAGAACVIVGIVCVNTWAKAEIKFNGDAQFRLRFHYRVTTDAKGEDSSAAPDYSNRYAWNLKWKVKVNENLGFGIRLSNPAGYATNNIKDNLTGTLKGNYTLVTLPELYFKWSLGLFSLSAGVIPVKGNTVLNLVAYETNERDTVPGSMLGYKNAGASPWKVVTNNSQKGLDFGFLFVDKKEFSFGMNVVTALAEDAKLTDKYDAFKMDQFRFIVSFPMAMMEKKLYALPVMHARLNAYRSKDYEEADHSVTGGCDVLYRPIDKLGIMVGLAGGLYGNKSQEGEVRNNKAVPQTEPFGVLLNSAVTLNPGFGKAKVFFAFSQVRDRKAAKPLNNNLLHWDITYGMPIKSLTIMPRMRIWHYTKEDADKKKTDLRPELILKAKF